MAIGTLERKAPVNQQGKPPALPGETPEKSVVDVVGDRVQGFIKSGQLHLPADYSVENALKSAYLALQMVEDKDHQKALKVCEKSSIANALLDMIVQGLNPGKKQCYFIAYGKTLVCQRSYFGSMAVAQMVNPAIKDWGYAVVYDGDEFEYGIEHGKKSVIFHKQKLENVDKKTIAGAYCIALDKDGNPIRTEIMTIDEIHQAWRQSKMNPFDEKGNLKDSSTHGKFTADMALKTVINKCCKITINASSDNTLLLERINRNEDLADAASAQVEIAESANQGSVVMIPETTTAESKPEQEQPKVEREPGQDTEETKAQNQQNQTRAPGF